MNSFITELENLINRYSKENDNNTPDFILAKYLQTCLDNYSATVNSRDKWFNVDMWKKDNLTAAKDFSELLTKEMESINNQSNFKE